MTTAHGHELEISHPGPLLRTLGDNWVWLLLRGIAGVAFGIFALAWPAKTLVIMVFAWGAYAIVEGIFALLAAVFGIGLAAGQHRWWLAIAGVASIAAGVFAFTSTITTAQILLLVVATWSIVIGLSTIWGAIELRREIDGEWLLAFGGALSVAFGVLLFTHPAVGLLTIVWLLAGYAIVLGASYIGLAFWVRTYR